MDLPLIFLGQEYLLTQIALSQGLMPLLKIFIIFTFKVPLKYAPFFEPPVLIFCFFLLCPFAFINFSQSKIMPQFFFLLQLYELLLQVFYSIKP